MAQDETRITAGSDCYIRCPACKVRLKLTDQRPGDIDHPKIPGKAIQVDQDLRGERELEITLHEALHACVWALDDEIVTEAAEGLARLLWRLGYRKDDV